MPDQNVLSENPYKKPDEPAWHVFVVNYYRDKPKGWRRWPWHGCLHAMKNRTELSIEWAPSWPGVFGLHIGGHDKTLLLNVWFFAQLYFGITTPTLNRWFDKFTHYEQDREIYVSFHDGGVWWNIWRPWSTWSAAVPWWRNGAFIPLDFLFGPYMRQDQESHSVSDVELPMPEGVYYAKITIERWAWGRKRLPWRSYAWHAEIEPTMPVPVPGKGENSWDCGQDAVCSMCCVIDRPSAVLAANRLIASVLETRHNRGGPAWRPEVAVHERRLYENDATGSAGKA